MSFIVVRGNPVDGFYYHGPFQTHADALAFAEDSEEPWWIAELEEP